MEGGVIHEFLILIKMPIAVEVTILQLMGLLTPLEQSILQILAHVLTELGLIQHSQFLRFNGII